MKEIKWEMIVHDGMQMAINIEGDYYVEEGGRIMYSNKMADLYKEQRANNFPDEFVIQNRYLGLVSLSDGHLFIM